MWIDLEENDKERSNVFNSSVFTNDKRRTSKAKKGRLLCTYERAVEESAAAFSVDWMEGTSTVRRICRVWVVGAACRYGLLRISPHRFFLIPQI